MGIGNRDDHLMLDKQIKQEPIYVEGIPEAPQMQAQPKWQEFHAPVQTGPKKVFKQARKKRLRQNYMQMTEEEREQLRNKTEYIHTKIEKEDELYFAKAAKSHQIKNINQAIITVLGKEIYDLMMALRMSEEELDRTSVLHHARGTQLVAEGKTVLKFDLAGTGYKQLRNDQNGFLGRDHLEESEEAFNKKLKKVNEAMIKLGDSIAQSKNREMSKEEQKVYDELKKKYQKLQEQLETRKKFGEAVYGDDKHKKYVLRKEDQTGRKISYSIAGAQKLLNRGDYKIENVTNYFLETSTGELNRIFHEWQESGTKGPDIHLFIRGHSRGGVAAVRGAMKLQKWLNDNWPQYVDSVKFELTQYDPVAGAGSNYGTYSELDLQGSEEELAKHGMAPLKNAETTLVYSMHTDKWYGGFRPQIVKGAKRVILSPYRHNVGLDNVDESQVRELKTEDGKVLERKEKGHRIGYTDLQTGEVYRQSGLSELAEGLYILDQSNNLVKMTNYEDVEKIINLVTKDTHTQDKRHNIVKDVAKAWFHVHEDETVEQEKSEHVELKSQMYEVLFDQKRSIFHKKKDSREMTAVKQSIEAVNRILEKEVSHQSLRDLTQEYKTLISACAVYLKRTPFTPLGRARKKLVKTLQTRSEAEQNFLMNLSDARVAEYRESGYAWDYILREARSARITKIPAEEQPQLKDLAENETCELQRGQNTYVFRKEKDLSGSADSARKNVAARSLSELLGVQDMFAQAKLAEFQLPRQAGQAQPEIVRGILTKKEQGKTMDEVKKEAQEKKLKLVYSDEAKQQLTQLRLMDLIMGYVGRGDNGFLAKTEYGETPDGEACLRVTGLMVHENALATFTDRTFRSMSGDDHPLTDVTGALRPEYVDRTFLDKLQLLSDDLIDMSLCHVLTEKERKHVKQRLHALRKIWQDHPVLVGSIARRRR